MLAAAGAAVDKAKHEQRDDNPLFDAGAAGSSDGGAFENDTGAVSPRTGAVLSVKKHGMVPRIRAPGSPRAGGMKGALLMKSALGKSFGQASHNLKDLTGFIDGQVFGHYVHDEGDEDEEKNAESLRGKWFGLLHPMNTRRAYYDGFQLLALLYTLWMIPYRFAFAYMPPVTSFAFWVDVAVDTALLIDIVLNFRVYIVDGKTQELIVDPKVIKKSYLRGWFWTDMMAVLPVDYVLRLINASEEAQAEGRAMRALRMARIVRFARVLKILNFARTLRKIRHRIGLSKLVMASFFRVLVLIFVMMAAGHFFGCLFLFLGRDSVELGEHSWMNWQLPGLLPHPCCCRCLADLPCISQYAECCTQAPSCRLTREILNSEAFESDAQTSQWSQYSDAFYWAMVVLSTVGFGDIAPVTSGEKWFTVVMILFGGFMYAMIIGVFADIVANLTRDQVRFDAKMRAVSEYMLFLDAEEDLRDQVHKYYTFKYNKRTLFDQNSIMDELPTKLLTQMVLAQFEDVIESVPFFKGIRKDAIVEICTRLRSFSAMPGDVIVDEGTAGTELFIVTRGKAFSVEPHVIKGVQGVVHEYGTGAFFGEMQFLQVNDMYDVEVTARTYCELSSLDALDITGVLARHKDVWTRLQNYSEVRRSAKEFATRNHSATQEEMAAFKNKLKAQHDQLERESAAAAAKAHAETSGTSNLSLRQLAKTAGADADLNTVSSDVVALKEQLSLILEKLEHGQATGVRYVNSTESITPPPRGCATTPYCDYRPSTLRILSPTLSPAASRPFSRRGRGIRCARCRRCLPSALSRSRESRPSGCPRSACRPPCPARSRRRRTC